MDEAWIDVTKAVLKRVPVNDLPHTHAMRACETEAGELATALRRHVKQHSGYTVR